MTDRKGQPLSRRKIGQLGEKIALRHLQAKGWKLLYRNYRGPHGGEIDLVMRGGDRLDTLVFIEVKTRRHQGYGRPLDAVTSEKKKLIMSGADSWLQALGRRDLPWRFDVTEIILQSQQKPLITHVEDAF